MDEAIALGEADQAIVQLVYDLMAQRGAWPTFTALDLRADRELAIEDVQAALAAVPVGYIRRPWVAHGFSDNDEVRLTLRGVAVCRCGDDDLALLAQLVAWTTECEGAAPAAPEDVVTVSSDAFAAHLGIAWGPPSTNSESVPANRGNVEVAAQSTSGLTVSSDVSDSAPTNAMPEIPSDIAAARDRMTRLRVIAELLPRFWTGISYQPQEPWVWQFTVDRQRVRPYRRVRGPEALLEHAEPEGDERSATFGAAAPGQSSLQAGGGTGVSGETMSRPAAAVPTFSSGDGRELAIQLTLLREEIADAAAELVRLGRFDDAIFAAFRRVEHEIQQRTGSAAIGNELIKQAFRDVSQPIRISNREQDTERLVELFSGAIGLYKGDRSHKDRPLLPCRSRRGCLRILAYASSLLDLLDRDVDRAPVVRGYEHRQGDLLTLWVERADAQADVWLDESTRLTTISYRPGTIVVSVAGVPVGEHRLHLVHGTRQGPATTVWLTREPGQSSWYRVIEVNLPLYSDAEGRKPLDPTNGVRLAVYESGVKSERIMPTRQTYQVGHYVDWGSQSGEASRTGAVWVRDYRGGPLVQIWDDATLFDGQPLAPAHAERLMNISMQPGRLSVRNGEKVPLRVMGHYTDGTATWTKPIENPEVTSTDDKVAYFKGGVLYAKKPGSVMLRCLHAGCYAEASGEVAAHPRGTVTELLTGLPPVSGVAWTPRGLVVSTRGTDLWRVGIDGAYRLVAATPESVRHHGTDTLAAREDGELAIRLGGLRDILVLHQGDDYTSSHWVTPDADGVPMASVWDGDELLVAMHTGELYRVGMDGKSTLVTIVDGVPVDATRMNNVWFVLSRVVPEGPVDGLWQVPLADPNNSVNLLADQQVGGVSGVLWTGSALLLSDFHAGNLLRLSDGRVDTLTSGLINPTQLTIAGTGDIYIAEFGAGAVRRLLV